MFLSKHFLPILGVLVLTGTTVTTSVAGMNKIMSQLNTSNTPSIPEIKKTVETAEKPEIKETKQAPQATSLRPSVSVTPTHPASLQQLKTTMGASTAQPQNTAINTSNRCIITLWSNQYDVTSLQTSHSGGNVFQCGADMTAVYQSQHGTNLSRMQQYLVTNTGGSTSTGGSSGQSGSQPPSSQTGSTKEREFEDRDSNEQEQPEAEKKQAEQLNESLKKAAEEQKEVENNH